MIDRAYMMQLTEGRGLGVKFTGFSGKLGEARKVLLSEFAKFMGVPSGVLTIRGRKRIRKGVMGHLTLKEGPQSNFDVVVPVSSGDSFILYVLAHELTHLKQVMDGRLTLQNDTIHWKGRPYMTVGEYKKLSGKAEMKKLPWEAESYRAQKILPKQFLSRVLPTLKGKNSLLDKMIELDLI